MAKHSSLAHGENETNGENAEATSAGKRSRRSASEPITLETRLRIIQQAVHDYQTDGGKVGVTAVEKNGRKYVAIMLEGVVMDGESLALE